MRSNHFVRDDLYIPQLRQAKRLSTRALLPQPVPPPLLVDLPVKRQENNNSPVSSTESTDEYALPVRSARREDRHVPKPTSQPRPVNGNTGKSLADRVSRRENARNREQLAKRLRGSSAIHSESTGSLVDLARGAVDASIDIAPMRAPAHRRRASESSGFFTGHPPKRPHSDRYIRLPSADDGVSKKRTRPLALTEFSLYKTLGSGGTATVVRAQPIPGSYAASIIPADEVALKAVAKKGMNRRAQHYLKREIHIHHHVQSHPHIASLYEVFQDSAAFYLVMEFLRGSDLYNALKRERRGISEKIALSITAQILDALQYMHSLGYAHRDIKPENIMFVERPSFAEGRVPNVKLVDFGLASARDPKASEKERHSSEKCGTLRYAAPEIVTETSYVPELCDIWSVGVVLYSMIAHRNPYTGKTEKEVLRHIQHAPLSFEGREWHRVTDETKDFIRACLSLKPSDRPGAVKAFESVEKILELLSRSPRSPARPHSDSHRESDVCEFSSHVTPEGGSSTRRRDTGGKSEEGSPPRRTSSDDGNEQPTNFLDGIIKVFFSGGSSPDRSRSDNSS